MPSSPAAKKIPGAPVAVFFPGESHTLAGLLRGALPSRSEREPASCVVVDALNEAPGLRVRCASREGLLAALDEARAWVRAARAAPAAAEP